MRSMETWEIVVLAVVALLALLALGGAVANARRRRALAERFGPQIRAADAALAAAHAEDKGWDRAHLEEAARREFETAKPGTPIRDMALVQVVDKPGQEEDEAVFRIDAPDGETTLTLGRDGDRWVLARVT
jgi:type II secretory pathway pseudopilin PulG